MLFSRRSLILEKSLYLLRKVLNDCSMPVSDTHRTHVYKATILYMRSTRRFARIADKTGTFTSFLTQSTDYKCMGKRELSEFTIIVRVYSIDNR